MYVLSLKTRGEVKIAKGKKLQMRVLVLSIRPSEVKIGFDAPDDVSIWATVSAGHEEREVQRPKQRHRRFSFSSWFGLRGR